MGNDHVPIFIHSLWRAGSTYIFNVFRRSESGYWAYQEPVHEIALVAKDHPDMLNGFTGEAMIPLRHPKLDKPYFYELQQTHQAWHSVVEKCIFYDDYFDVAHIEPLQRYYQALIDAAPMRPVMQDCRTASRIGAIKQAMGGVHIYLWRNPWDQWWSFKVSNYFDAACQIILGANAAPDVVRRLRHEISYVEFHHDDITKEFDHFGQCHPNSENSYLVFYTLWCLGLIEGNVHADQSINIDALSNSVNYRATVTEKLVELGVPGIDFSDCIVPQAYYSNNEVEFFNRIEDRVHGLLLASGYTQEILNKLRKLRSEHQPERLVNHGHLTRDLERMRDIALRYETSEANFMRHHYQSLNDILQQRTHLQNELTTVKQKVEYVEKEASQIQTASGILQQSLTEKEQQFNAQVQQNLEQVIALIQQQTDRERELMAQLVENQRVFQEAQQQYIHREQEQTTSIVAINQEIEQVLQQRIEREQEVATQLQEITQRVGKEKSEIEERYEIHIQELRRQREEQEWLNNERIAELNGALQQLQTQATEREVNHASGQRQLQRELAELQRQRIEREQEVATQIQEITQRVGKEKSEIEEGYEIHIQELRRQREEQEWLNNERIAELNGILQQLQILVAKDKQKKIIWRLFHAFNQRTLSKVSDLLANYSPELQPGSKSNQLGSQSVPEKRCQLPVSGENNVKFNEKEQISHDKGVVMLEKTSRDRLFTKIEKSNYHVTRLFAFDGADFIQITYLLLLDRIPDHGGFEYYMGRLALGFGKSSVVVQIYQSNECKIKENEIPGLSNLINEERLKNKWWYYWLYKPILQEHYRNAKIYKLSNFVDRCFSGVNNNLNTTSSNNSTNDYENILGSVTDSQQGLRFAQEKLESEHVVLQNTFASHEKKMNELSNLVEEFFVKSMIKTNDKLEDILKLDGDSFIDKAFLALLGQHPDSNQQTYFGNRLTYGNSKLSILQELCMTEEAKSGSNKLELLENRLEMCIFAIDGLKLSLSKYK